MIDDKMRQEIVFAIFVDYFIQPSFALFFPIGAQAFVDIFFVEPFLE
jgi:hypothetical protein